MSTVTLAKLGDDAREDRPGVGDMGAGPVEIIGGLPARRVAGPLIRVRGMRVRVPATVRIPGPPRVNVIAVAIESDGFRDRAGTVPSFTGVVITADGAEFATGPRGDMESVRRAWLRFAVESGTFAGVTRMS